MPDTSADNWYGLLAPARTPPAVVAKLHDAVVAALEAPDVRDKLVQSGAIPAPTSSAEFGKLMSDELARWGRVVKEKVLVEDVTFQVQTGEVLAHLAVGKRNAAIADELGISQSTIKFHVASLLRKLDVANRGEAAAMGIRAGIVASEAHSAPGQD